MSVLARAREILRTRLGHSEFRPHQARVIHHVMAGRDVLAVLPTGGGKSACYQVPALASDGLTVVVSPLIALMQDQVRSLTSRGVAAATINSTQSAEEQQAVLDRARGGRLRMLLVSPERLPRLVSDFASAAQPIRRLVVDEAHCIVEWGHDFRPSYRALRRARVAMGSPPCLALTASATPAVRAAIRESLGFRRDAHEVVGSFDRPNLRFEVAPVTGRDDRLARLVVLVRTTRGTAIVYAPTRGLTEALARVLVESGVCAAAYHAGLDAMRRRDVLADFTSGATRVVIATCAFGMGIDKPDVRLVAHWSMPSTPEAYYQEAGRAGRDGQPARCVLFHHPADDGFARRQLTTTFPPEQLLTKLWSDPSLRIRHPAAVLAAADRLMEELQPQRGPVNWDRVRRRRREAVARLAMMTRYATTRQCRRVALMGWFGERISRCAGCDRCSPGRRVSESARPIRVR